MKTCVNCGLRTEPQTADKESSCKCDLPLVEGEDFYYENGLMVFTEKYHIKKDIAVIVAVAIALGKTDKIVEIVDWVYKLGIVFEL